jgi:hypothetical protein
MIRTFIIFSIVLFILFFSNNTISAQNEAKIIPTDDAYVLADLSDPKDASGLMQTNTGNLEVIELISSWNVTENNNAYVTMGYLKFDLSKQNTYNLEKAELKVLTREVALSETPKNVVLLHVSNNNWKESDITYLKRPFFPTVISSSAEIATANTWYSWDVTNLVMQNPGSELSVALTFETGRDNTQDYVSFYSKEATDSLAPFLELTFVPESEPILSDNDEMNNVSLYAGIAIAVGGILGGYTISKRKAGAASRNEQLTPRPHVKCSTCNSLIPTNFKFCPICGSKMNQS